VASGSKTSSKPQRRRGSGVLIVDDTPHVREMYDEYLTAHGFRVSTAPDAEVGIARALHRPPDVIVMDLSMPKIDGVTAIKFLKADPRTRHVPVILLTGYPYKAIERGAIEAGADAFLTKPCLPEDLEAQVDRLIEQRARPAA
jgi:two-component system cell cycle response regulator DivK